MIYREKAAELLSKMTLDEKFQQMNIFMRVDDTFEKLKNENSLEPRGCIFAEGKGFSPNHFNAIQKYFVNKTRLGIPILLAGEGIHGLIYKGATAFPQCAGLGGTFDREMMSQVADVIGSEAAACGTRQLYAPDLDIPRDPRWGRTQECYGEDPYLVGEMGVRYVKGIQDHSVAATLKHFIAHAVPENGINLAPVHMGEREMREIMLEPFKKCIEAGALSVMPAYNELDGEPIHSSQKLMRKLLREELKFDGMTISDYGAIEMLHTFHYVAEDRLKAGKLALEAGVDMEAPEPFGYGEELKEAVLKGEFDEKYIDEAVLNILILKYRIGLFDNPYIDDETLSGLHSDASSKLALKADEESILLLKNDGILPLAEDKIGKIAVIGNNAEYSFMGDYIERSDACIDFYNGMVNRLGKDRVLCARGCNAVTGTEEMISEAVDKAKQADIVFLVLGDGGAVGGGVGGNIENMLTEITCSEGVDTHDLSLPPSQQRLFDAISALGKPCVFVMMAGRTYALEREVSKVNAFMFSWGGGEQCGTAFANLIFGDVSPSAKLSISFPKSTGHIPCHYNYKVSARGRFYKQPGSVESPGRDYVMSSPEAWLPFGYGLSYTKVEYSDLRVIPQNDGTVKIKVDVKNSGKYEINESVLVFVRTMYAPITPLVKRLRAFDKIKLEPNEKKTVEFILDDEDFSYVDIDYKTVRLSGKYKIMVDSLECDFDLR